MNEYLEFTFAIFGGFVGALAGQILIYKFIHPYIVIPYLRKKRKSREINKNED